MIHRWPEAHAQLLKKLYPVGDWQSVQQAILELDNTLYSRSVILNHACMNKVTNASLVDHIKGSDLARELKVRSGVVSKIMKNNNSFGIQLRGLWWVNNHGQSEIKKMLKVPDDHMTIDEASTYLGLERGVVWSACSREVLPYVKVNGLIYINRAYILKAERDMAISGNVSVRWKKCIN